MEGMSESGHLQTLDRVRVRSVHPPTADIRRLQRHVGFVPILLQKSKVASVRIFGEILKREAIDDSDSLSRVTEVAYEFEAMGSLRSLHENRAYGPQDIRSGTTPCDVLGIAAAH